MKKVLLIVLAVVLFASIGGVAMAGTDMRGNDLPKVDKLFKMNIIGVPGDKSVNMGDDNGKRIFVPLKGNCKILLTEGPFDILDANGTDGVAEFQLPAPEYDETTGEHTNTGVAQYSVYLRVLGKPGGEATIKSCECDYGPDGEYGTADDGDCACSVAPYILEVERETGPGKTKAQNVTKYLLYVWLDTDGDGDADTRVPLFWNSNKGYLWDYDNNGLKVAQLWFMDTTTDVGNPPDTPGD